MKKIIASLVCIMLTSSIFVGCAKEPAVEETSQETNAETTTTEGTEPYKISIVTPTISSSEDEFRAAAMMEEMYPEIVTHRVLPENEMMEVETCISTIVSEADDPMTKAIIVYSGQSGLVPAFQQIKEKNEDIIVMGYVSDDPEMTSEYMDVIIQTNDIKRGETIPTKAKEMGADTFIHYSFPTHLSVPTIAARRDMMKATCEKLGMEFVEVVTPDHQAGSTVEAMQQFLREDIARQVEAHGQNINIFATNCKMWDAALDEAIKNKLIVAEQCCPTPTQAFPTVLGLAIPEDSTTDYELINGMISDKLAEKDMTGRISAWPIPSSVYLPQLAVYTAMDMIENGKTEVTQEEIAAIGKDKIGVGAQFDLFEYNEKTYDNYFVMIMDDIFY